ncbi:sigma-70 family RNA polymerase sigma factor [Chitinophaga sp. SYP-B3965]|uniref:RNA polymerase sigma factor n=1 Tax=Chitinophaga sp. SYP-B3965 TaxID=2663120 RepID=UPI001299B881|nr:sigma-70 family RNA polymerase sigma factor [Chitinophaga sp. SYP-B3965]MRG45172.1 sigma-70 family RNA polymerase sigma factor [Chitinophaga sp. SYP-B3965]
MSATGTANSILIAQLNNSDDAAFEAVYHQYHQAIFANILRLVKQQHKAEDILQDVFVTLWESRFKLTEKQSVSGWLFTTSYFKALEYLRKSVKENITLLSEEQYEFPDDDTDLEETYQQKLSIITSVMELLPPRKRTAFQLCRVEGKSYEEAAAMLEISVESVRDYVKTSSIFIRKHILEHNTGISFMGLYLVSLYLQA